MLILCALPTLLAGCDADEAVGLDASIAAALTPASGISATALSASRIDISWQDVANTEDGYELHRSTTGASGTFAVHATLASSTWHTDAGLAPQTEYCYRVRAFRMTGRKLQYGAFSSTACATTLAPPPAPTGTSAVPNGSTVVDVGWTDPSSAETGFRVERAAAAAGPWTEIRTTAANVTTHRDGNRTPEQQVCYRVLTLGSGTESPASLVDCTTPPAAPSNLVATGVDAQSIDLAWTDRSAVEDGYAVLRSLDNFSWVTVATLPANATTHRDGGLANDARYWYRVRALKDGGHSDQSNSDDAVTIGGPPAAPSGVDAFPGGSTFATVVWSNASVSVQQFRIERSLDGGGSWITAGTSEAWNTYFHDPQRSPEQQVCYRVFAINAMGESEPSATTCTIPPAAPTRFTAWSDAVGTVEMRWSDNSAVNTSYVVERLFTYSGYYGYEYAAWVAIETFEGGATGGRLTNLQLDTYFQLRVIAQYDGGPSDPSNEAASWSAPAPPTPTNLAATAVSSTRIDLTWTDNSATEMYFYIERCSGTAQTCEDWQFTTLTYAPAGATSYGDTSVQPGTSYTYRVRAYFEPTYSDPSNEATATTPLSEQE